jgi:hypothetical protein
LQGITVAMPAMQEQCHSSCKPQCGRNPCIAAVLPDGFMIGIALARQGCSACTGISWSPRETKSNSAGAEQILESEWPVGTTEDPPHKTRGCSENPTTKMWQTVPFIWDRPIGVAECQPGTGYCSSNGGNAKRQYHRHPGSIPAMIS